MVKCQFKRQEAEPVVRSGSRLRVCDLGPRAKNCFDSKLFCSIMPIRTYQEKLQIVKNRSTMRGVIIQIFSSRYVRSFDNIKIYMN